MKIAFITSDWDWQEPPLPGGSGFVRMYTPALALKEAGHEVCMGYGVASYKDGKIFPLDWKGTPKFFEADIVVIQRWMHVRAAEIIKAAREAGQVVIQDIDDSFFDLHKTNAAYKAVQAKNNPMSNRNGYHKAIAASDLLTCSTPFLAKRYSERLGVKTVLLRNFVDVNRFTDQPVRDTRQLRVGWVGAVPWRSGDLEIMRDPLKQFIEESGSSFVHHGAMRKNPTQAFDLLELPHGEFDYMRSSIQYPEIVRNFDVGTVPLNDLPFNRAKSAIKGMEYASAKIPFVASNLDEYRYFGVGDLVSTNDEWLAAFRRMQDPTYRQEKVDEAYERVLKEDVSVRWKEWEDVYLDLHSRLVGTKVG